MMRLLEPELPVSLARALIWNRCDWAGSCGATAA